MDLRHDPKTIEELHKTSQKPVSYEQVSLVQTERKSYFNTYNRARKSERRSKPTNTSNALLGPTRVFVRSSKLLLVPP